jgi:hypothetical protein
MTTVVKMSLEELEYIKEESYKKGIEASSSHSLVARGSWQREVLTNDELAKELTETISYEHEEKEKYKQLYNEAILKLDKAKNWWKFWK